MLPRAKLFKCTGPFLSSGCPDGKVSGSAPPFPCHCSFVVVLGAHGTGTTSCSAATVITFPRRCPPSAPMRCTKCTSGAQQERSRWPCLALAAGCASCRGPTAVCARFRAEPLASRQLCVGLASQACAAVDLSPVPTPPKLRTCHCRLFLLAITHVVACGAPPAILPACSLPWLVYAARAPVGPRNRHCSHPYHTYLSSPSSLQCFSSW